MAASRLGLMLAGAFALEAVVGARDAAERRALFIAWAKFGVAALLVACITPYGPESILVTSRIFGLGDALSVIAEWRAPDFQKQPMQELVLLVALYLALSRGLKLPLIRLLIVLGLVHLFLRYARNAELLAMLAPLVIAPLLARQFPAIAAEPQAGGPLQRARRGRPVRAALAALPRARRPAGGRADRASPASRRRPTTRRGRGRLRARRRPQGQRVFNHYGFGGYLISAGIPTFIDGRGELYGGDFIKRYVEAVSLRGEEPLEALLDRYAIDWTLLPQGPARQPASGAPAGLAPRLQRRGGHDLRARQ